MQGRFAQAVRVVGWAWVLGMAVTPAWSGVDVLTHRYNATRQGLNDRETRLTPANVKASGFGKVFEHAVDGQVYAQPLVVTALAMPGRGLHDVVYVATQANTVYAFDASNANGANAQPLWQVSLVPCRPGMRKACNCSTAAIRTMAMPWAMP